MARLRRGLQQRGSLTVWCTPQAVQAWYYQGPPQREAHYTFSEVAIQTALTLRLLYHWPLRQTEGFVASLLALMGLDLRVPDHTTLSRRQAGLAVAWPPQAGRRTDALGGGFDRAESVWRRRMEGASARLEQALPIGVNEATGEIVAQTLTTNSQDDAGQVEPLLAQIEGPVEALDGDGAYDKRKVFKALAAPEQGGHLFVRSFRRARTPKSSNMATPTPSHCPAMRRSEPSANRAVEVGNRIAAIITAR